MSNGEGNQLTINLTVDEAGQLIQLMDMALRYNGINAVDAVSHFQSKLRIAKAIADNRLVQGIPKQLLTAIPPTNIPTVSFGPVTSHSLVQAEQHHQTGEGEQRRITEGGVSEISEERKHTE